MYYTILIACLLSEGAVSVERWDPIGRKTGSLSGRSRGSKVDVAPASSTNGSYPYTIAGLVCGCQGNKEKHLIITNKLIHLHQ